MANSLTPAKMAIPKGRHYHFPKVPSLLCTPLFSPILFPHSIPPPLGPPSPKCSPQMARSSSSRAAISAVQLLLNAASAEAAEEGQRLRGSLAEGERGKRAVSSLGIPLLDQHLPPPMDDVPQYQQLTRHSFSEYAEGSERAAAGEAAKRMLEMAQRKKRANDIDTNQLQIGGGGTEGAGHPRRLSAI